MIDFTHEYDRLVERYEQLQNNYNVLQNSNNYSIELFETSNKYSLLIGIFIGVVLSKSI